MKPKYWQNKLILLICLADHRPESRLLATHSFFYFSPFSLFYCKIFIIYYFWEEVVKNWYKLWNWIDNGRVMKRHLPCNFHFFFVFSSLFFSEFRYVIICMVLNTLGLNLWMVIDWKILAFILSTFYFYYFFLILFLFCFS